jgi:hypothetical protein
MPHPRKLRVIILQALSTGERHRLRHLERKLARAKRGSNRRARLKLAIARLNVRGVNARRDWAEKLSTDLARRFDVIRVEDLRIREMTRSGKGSVIAPGRHVRAKAGLNRQILSSGWGILLRRLEQKAPGRVEKINPAYTSQRCSACGHVAGENRKSQAVFACTACRHSSNADVNAARNIAAGHAVTARGGVRVAGPVNREPQPAFPVPWVSQAEIPAFQGGRMSNLDALVPRIVHGAQGYGGRVDGVADLHRPLAGVQPGLVDGHVGVDHRQPDRAAQGEAV